MFPFSKAAEIRGVQKACDPPEDRTSKPDVHKLFSRHKNRASLSNEQLRGYAENGFVLASGLVAADVIQKAQRVVLDVIPDLQTGSHHMFVDHPTVVKCFSENVRSMAAHLAGVGKAFPSPSTVYTISVFSQNDPWQWPVPHIDHAREQDAHRTFPPPFCVGCLIYLTDVSTHGGGTVVWPGSHKQVESLALSDSEKYRYLWAVNRDLRALRFTSGPREVQARAGDVFFYHYLLAHSGSANTGSVVRVALNHKW